MKWGAERAHDKRSLEMRVRSAAAVKQNVMPAASTKVRKKSRKEKAANAHGGFLFPRNIPHSAKRRQPNDSASPPNPRTFFYRRGAAHARFCFAKSQGGFAALPCFGKAETRRVRRPHYPSHTGVISSVSQPFCCVKPSKPSSAQRSVTFRYSNVVILRLSSGKSAAL